MSSEIFETEEIIFANSLADIWRPKGNTLDWVFQTARLTWTNFDDNKSSIKWGTYIYKENDTTAKQYHQLSPDLRAGPFS